MIPSISHHHPVSASDNTSANAGDTAPQQKQQGHTHKHTDSHHSSSVPVSRGIYSLHTVPGGLRELGADHRGSENNIRPLSHFSGRGGPSRQGCVVLPSGE